MSYKRTETETYAGLSHFIQTLRGHIDLLDWSVEEQFVSCDCSFGQPPAGPSLNFTVFIIMVSQTP